jgi:gamma-glutamyl hercynylcysteine S-oxide synthase
VPPRAAETRGALRCAGGELALGRPAGAPGFWFDNEQPGCRVELAPFEIDAAPVTQGAYARFVDAGGPPPERWRRGATGWEQRWFDRWLPIDRHAPVVHVDAYEAAAFAQWAGRRLPSAAEWERACTEPGFDWGEVWEWTASDFQPYPGFVAGPYAEYSAPWFGDHRELRGASVATHARMRHPAYRNFFLPQRRDLFTGFRTAADL